MMSTSIPIFTVPYVVEEPGRERTFTAEMEKAVMLCLAEAKRRKPGILGGASEELDYIAKFYYPLWGIPWEGKCVVIDGLGLASVTIVHLEVPNVEEFTEELRKCSVSYNLFRETLKKYGQIFSGFASRQEKVVESLIGESSILKSLSSLVSQPEDAEKISRDEVFLVHPMLSREETEKRAESLTNEGRGLQIDVQTLEYAITALKEQLEHHKEKLSIEIEQISEGYEERISKIRKPVDERIKKLVKEKEKEDEKAALIQEKRLNEILRGEDRLEKKIEEMKRLLKTQHKRRKDQKRKYPKRSTTRIDRRIESYKQKLDDLFEKMRSHNESKRQLQIEAEETTKRIEQKHLSLAAKEMEKLEILDQSRNLEVSGKREIIREIEDTSSAIEAQIKQLVAEKVKNMNELEAKALPFKVDRTILIGIPFYLVQYRSPGKTRMDVYPPVIAASYDGIVRRIQKAILSFSPEARIQLLLSPRWPELNDGIFTVFKRGLEASPVLREGISEIAKSRNFLESKNFGEQVAKGLGELEAEGWLNAKEKETILNVYTR